MSSDPDDIDTYNGDVSYAISDLLVKWKNLEVLKLDGCLQLVQIIGKIGLNCKNLVELCVTNTDIGQEVASAIVSNLSTIKHLVLDETNLEKVNLELIVRGCKELELLYVRDCVGFDEDDEEILMLASGIKDFQCDGSEIYNYSSEEYVCNEYEFIDHFDDLAIYFDY